MFLFIACLQCLVVFLHLQAWCDRFCHIDTNNAGSDTYLFLAGLEVLILMALLQMAKRTLTRAISRRDLCNQVST
jgi:hypothetical protein